MSGVCVGWPGQQAAPIRPVVGRRCGRAGTLGYCCIGAGSAYGLGGGAPAWCGAGAGTGGRPFTFSAPFRRITNTVIIYQFYKQLFLLYKYDNKSVA